MLITAALVALAMPAAAQTRSFYDGNGSFAGSSVTRGNSSSFYDGQGRFSGSAVRHGNSRSFYDGQGRYTGLGDHRLWLVRFAYLIERRRRKGRGLQLGARPVADACAIC